LDGGKASINLTYKLDGSKIDLYIRNGDCHDNIGRYQWNLKGEELYFAKIVDMCAGEELILVSHPLVRTSE
jgi:hypothetical protein